MNDEEVRFIDGGWSIKEPRWTGNFAPPTDSLRKEKEMNDKTTRWENVKGRARHIFDKHVPVDFEGEGPYPPGAEFAKALCEEMDRMQEETDFLRKRLAQLIEDLKKETSKE